MFVPISRSRPSVSIVPGRNQHDHADHRRECNPLHSAEDDPDSDLARLDAYEGVAGGPYRRATALIEIDGQFLATLIPIEPDQKAPVRRSARIIAISASEYGGSTHVL
jgi:hypothetical protein